MLPLARDSGWKGEETTLIALASGSMDGYLDTMYMHMDARSTHNIGSQSLHIYERACLFFFSSWDRNPVCERRLSWERSHLEGLTSEA